MKGLGPAHLTLSQPLKAAQTRAQWFRHNMFWQQNLQRRRRRKIVNFPTATPLEYGSRLRFGSLNVQGFVDTLKLENAMQLMKEQRLDVLFLSETKSTSYYSYLSEQHLVILSGNTKNKHAGVGAIISPHLLDVIQRNPRLIHLCFKRQGGNIHLLGAYGPHSGLDLETGRIPFWDTLEDCISKIAQPDRFTLQETLMFASKLPTRMMKVTGPFVFGKGPRYIDHNADSNRSLCVRSMQRLDMLEVASYKTPVLTQQITYSDKTAPPKDWSQFLLDPLVMQQVYDKIHFSMVEYSLSTAANIRSYLEMDTLLPAPKVLPHDDPWLFQRLDHTFTRSQWPSTVRHCKSKLFTGYPSDHYLKVTDVRVKLAAKPPRTSKPTRQALAIPPRGEAV